jgi:membrane-bound metal-dependent hydrolase YbcI (DUF457 family)
MTGIAAGLISGWILFTLGYPEWSIAVAGFSGYFGGTAPDWLEISHAERQGSGSWQRKSVIPHRTITHWFPVWLALVILDYYVFKYSYILYGDILAGFVAGGWMHLLMDIPNSTGIPIATPLAKSRISLRWWKSGNAAEPVLSTVFVILVALLILGQLPSTPLSGVDTLIHNSL